MKMIFLAFLLVLLSSCGNAMELDELGFIHLLAVDRGSVVTVSHPDQPRQPPILRTGKGADPQAALADADRGNERMPFLGGASYLLIGEEQAKQDVASALDLIFTDYAARMDVYVYIVREWTASEWTKEMSKSSQPVLEWMHNFGQRTRIGSPALRVKICQAVAGMAEGETVLLPGVRMPREAGRAASAMEDEVDEEDDDDGTEEDNGTLMISQPAGYAVVKEGRVAGWIEPEDCPIVDAVILRKRRIAPIAIPGEHVVEAEFSRRGTSELTVRVISPERMDPETRAALEETLRGGVKRIGQVIDGFGKTHITVAP
jgi:hypothetical protein